MSLLRKFTDLFESNPSKTLQPQGFHRTGPLEQILTPSPLGLADGEEGLDIFGDGDGGDPLEAIVDPVAEDLTGDSDTSTDSEILSAGDATDSELDEELDSDDSSLGNPGDEDLGDPIEIVDHLEDSDSEEELGGEAVDVAETDDTEASEVTSLDDSDGVGEDDSEPIDEEASEAAAIVTDTTSKTTEDSEGEPEPEPEPKPESVDDSEVVSESAVATDADTELDPEPDSTEGSSSESGTFVAVAGDGLGDDAGEEGVDVTDAIDDASDSDTDLNSDADTDPETDIKDEDESELIEDLIETTGFTFDLSAINNGLFTVGADGQVGVDFLSDGGGYKGQLAFFSLDGLDGQEFESFDAFVAEAVDRASSNSDRGHLVIDDKVEGAKFASAENSGDYRGVKLFAMKAGDTFAVMLVPNSTLSAAASGSSMAAAVRPLFSLSSLNPDDEFHFAQIADVTGDGSTFVLEDMSTETDTDRDYNDVVFRVTGATGQAVKMVDVIAEGEDWTDSELFERIVGTFQEATDIKDNSDAGDTDSGSDVTDNPGETTGDGGDQDNSSGSGSDDSSDLDDGIDDGIDDVIGEEIPIPAELQDVVTAAQTLESEPVTAQPLIGVIDSGLTAGHADLDYSNVTLGTDFVDDDANPLLDTEEGSKHGDHITGIIAAERDNGEGIDGINDDAPLFVSRAIGSGETAEAIVEFVDAAIASEQPNAVLNLSLDLTQVDADGNVTTRYEFTPEERGAIEYARQNGVILVVAAGNNADTMSVLGQASQEFDNIITVGAAQLDLVDGQWQASRADYSSYGNGLDVVAYGGTADDMVVSLTADGLGEMAGSSVATAKVTGAISRVWAVNPELSYRQVIEIIKQTATDIGAAGEDAETGAGLVNLVAAVAAAKSVTPEDYQPEAWFAPDSWSGEGKVTASERAAWQTVIYRWDDVESRPKKAVHSIVGEYLYSKVSSTGVVQHFYENGHLIVQPNGFEMWYGSASRWFGHLPFFPEPKPIIDLDKVLVESIRDTQNRIQTRISLPDGTILSDWTVAPGKTYSPISSAILNGKIYQSHRGIDNRIYTRSSTDGVNWSGWHKTPGIVEVATSVPDLTTFNGRLYQSHRGVEGNIYTRSSTDGVNWTSWKSTDGITLDPPVLASVNGKLYQAHRSLSNRIYTRSSTDGQVWSDWATSSNPFEQTPSAPAMIGFKNKLYQSHRGIDNQIFLRSSIDGINWNDWTLVPGARTPVAPEFEVAGDVLYQYHAGFDRTVYRRESRDGQNWSGWSSSGVQTLIESDTQSILFDIHQGLNNRIYTRLTYDGQVLDGVDWTSWVSTNPNENTPVMPTTTVVAGRVYQSHVGDRKQIYTRSSLDGINWTEWFSTDPESTYEKTDLPIALASFNGEVYQSHVGLSGKIYTRSSRDGRNWTSWKDANYALENTTHAVAMSEFNGKLYQAHTGKDGRLYTRSSDNGQNWSIWKSWDANGNAGIEKLNGSPVMTSFNGKLFQMHRGGEGQVFTRFSLDGESWSNWHTTTQEETSEDPWFGVLNDKLYQFHVGKDSKIYSRYSLDVHGISWSSWAWTGGTTHTVKPNPTQNDDVTSNGSSEWQNPLPGYSVTSGYGWRRDPFTGESKFHYGIDIGTSSTKPPIKAAKSGEIVYARWNDQGYGNLVIIDHGDGIRSYYAHLSKIGVSVGQKVAGGSYIGDVGSTGNSTGNHLHIEVRVAPYQWKTNNRNPRDYIKF